MPSHRKRTWSKSGIRYMLHNPVYIGKIRWDGEIRDGDHEAIVDEDLWEAVQSRETTPAVNRQRAAAEA